MPHLTPCWPWLGAMDSGVRLPAPQSTCLHPSPQLFKGKFYHCLGVDTRNITNRSDCVAANYRWVHHKYNFDNLGQVCEPPPLGELAPGRSSPHQALLLCHEQWVGAGAGAEAGPGDGS